jgi:hypothetical protein
MKRSLLDSRIEAMLAACARHGLRLPPFAAPASIEEDRPKRYVTARGHSRFVALAG